MAGRRRNSLPPPAGAEGGYEFEVVEPGPPTYFTPPPAAKARGGLTPVGNGEGLPTRPAPFGRRTRPAKRRRHTEDDSHRVPADLKEPARFFDHDTLSFEASYQLGLTRYSLLDHSAAISLLEQSVAVARRVGDPRMTALALHSLGGIFHEVGRSAEAAELTVEVVRLAEASGDKKLLARALVSRGSLLRQLGRFEEAAVVLERALAVVDASTTRR